MKFKLEALQSALQPMPACSSAVVGLSGGMDSVVLLHSLNELSKQGRLGFGLRAIHVNHGLQVDADAWQRHCEIICTQWEIPLTIEDVCLGAGESDAIVGGENAARDARYQAIERQLQSGEALLLAHHRDDQMETLLLRLMRGAGSRGLAGIPTTRVLAAGFLFRPLLNFDRTALQKYATDKQLQWIDDQSNLDIGFDRNYCRHQLLPLIEKRWPGYRDSWNKTMVLAAEAEKLLQALAAIDLDNIATNRAAVIQIDQLVLLPEERQRNVLRYWLRQLGLPELGWNRLQQLSNEVLRASDSASASVAMQEFQLRRYKNCLYALQRIDTADTSSQIDWDLSNGSELELPGNGSLQAEMADGQGLKLADRSQLSIRYRSGGETCRLVGRPNKSLKKILQEYEIEPWFRDRVPLLYLDQTLVCIPGIGISEQHAAKTGECGLIINWSRPKFEIS